MLFRQVLHDDLGCASYVIADGGQAAVVDPKWEIADYLALAREHQLEIVRILETHTHADHVSGRRRLREATGATAHVPAGAGAADEHEPLRDGDRLRLGRATVAALATPGHRPEHLSFLVHDTGRTDEPWVVLTGDSLFVGDVARPDLAVDAEKGARALFRSLRRLLELPDHVEVWPAHVGGSVCGGSGMSEKPLSTIGFERRFNPYLSHAGEEEFVRELAGEELPQPPSVERVVELNAGALPGEPAIAPQLAPGRVRELLAQGAMLLDARAPRDYDAAHVPGSISVTGVSSGVGTRAAWAVDLDAPVVVAAASDGDSAAVVRKLEAVGFGRLEGFLAGGIPAWQAAGLDVDTVPAVDPEGLARLLDSGEVELLDVRERDEWRAGHVAGSHHLPYRELRDATPAELPPASEARPLAVACAAGNRSAVAVSLLRRRGLEHVIHVTDGGIADLERHGIALVSGD